MKKTVLFTAITFIVAVFIFYMSSQNGSVSGGESFGIIKYIVGISGIPVDFRTKKIAEKVLRKSAHFILYMIFGIFSGLSLYGICGAKNRKRPVVVIWLSAVLIVILYAASDEIHQIFVDGRSCEVRDILTDTAGGAAGAGMAILIGRFGKKKNKNTKKTQKIF